MKQPYTLNQHFNNISLIEKFNNTIVTIKNNQEKLNFINLLKDFIQKNEYYSSIQSFSILKQTLVDFIEYYHIDNYSNNELNERFINVVSTINSLFQEINNLYKVNLYFKGKDKYGLLENIIKANITLKLSGDIIKSDKIFNILVISEDTYNEDLNLNDFHKVIYYDKFINNSLSLVKQIYQQDYDYHYILNAIDKAKDSNIETIIVGSSYPLYGINEDNLNGHAVQLSLPSQDLYYSFKIAKDVIEKNNNIKKCIIGTAYWLFYVDLSKCSSLEASLRIPSVYYPLFQDSHNYSYIGESQKKSLQDFVDKEINYIFNVSELNKQLNKIVFKTYKSYFNDLKTRQGCSLLGNRTLSSLTIDEKFNFAKERAYSHNKIRLYPDTKDEYIDILKEFLIYLSTKKIKPVIVNFATTKYYNEFFDTEYISEYKKIINNLSTLYNFKFVDLNDYDIFTEEDFVDFDHMGDTGALKVSKILSDL